MSDESPTPNEDVTGLKNTINALRNELRDLRATYNGIDPEQSRNAIARLAEIEPEYEQFKTTIAEQTQLINDGKVSSTVASTLAGVKPEYHDLLRDNLRPLLQVGEDGNVVATNGRSLDDLRKDYQSKYPDMFLNGAAPVPAGAGNSQSNGSPAQPAAVVQRGKGGLIVGADPEKVASGKVKLE